MAFPKRYYCGPLSGCACVRAVDKSFGHYYRSVRAIRSITKGTAAAAAHWIAANAGWKRRCAVLWLTMKKHGRKTHFLWDETREFSQQQQQHRNERPRTKYVWPAGETHIAINIAKSIVTDARRPMPVLYVWMRIVCARWTAAMQRSAKQWKAFQQRVMESRTKASISQRICRYMCFCRLIDIHGGCCWP